MLQKCRRQHPARSGNSDAYPASKAPKTASKIATETATNQRLLHAPAMMLNRSISSSPSAFWTLTNILSPFWLNTGLERLRAHFHSYIDGLNRTNDARHPRPVLMKICQSRTPAPTASPGHGEPWLIAVPQLCRSGRYRKSSASQSCPGNHRLLQYR